MSKTAEEYELEIERLNGQIEALQSGFKKTRLRRKVREHAVSYTHLTLPTICSV